MDHFNATVHNGALVSTRHGLHVSKTKHQGTRFVNTFVAPTSSPSRKQKARSKIDLSVLKEHKYVPDAPGSRAGIASYRGTPRQKREYCTKSRKPESTTLASSSNSESDDDFAFVQGQACDFYQSTFASSLDLYTLDLSEASPTDIYTPNVVSPGGVPQDMSANLSFILQSLLQPCNVAQTTLESLESLVFFVQSISLSKESTDQLGLDPITLVEDRMWIENRLWQTSSLLCADTVGPVDWLNYDFPIQAESSYLYADTAVLEPDFSPIENQLLHITPSDSPDFLDTALRAASILYLQEFFPQDYATGTNKDVMLLLNAQVRSIVLHLHKREAQMQTSYFTNNDLTCNDLLRPILIWICMVACSIGSNRVSEVANIVDRMAYKDCLGILIGFAPTDVDELADTDFELCAMLPIQVSGTVVIEIGRLLGVIHVVRTALRLPKRGDGLILTSLYQQQYYQETCQFVTWCIYLEDFRRTHVTWPEPEYRETEIGGRPTRTLTGRAPQPLNLTLTFQRDIHGHSMARETMADPFDESADPAPAHPYFPPSAAIPGYVPNDLPVMQLVPVFGAVLFAVVGTALRQTARARIPLPMGERFAAAWFALCGFLHLAFEGYYLYNRQQLASMNTPFAQLWKEYALSDSRYLTDDVFTISVETITTFIWGPVCLLTFLAILTHARRVRHVLQIVVSTAHLYGVALYYLTNYTETRASGVAYSRPEAVYYWLYYVGFNLPWAVVPLVLLRQSWGEMGRAFEALAEREVGEKRE
ncbi:hypothetical protein G7046_g4188 [Stylonectria norvegica]|nr:hypothetical protein G7046_g4188 [Stylonectria norvegica]